MKKLTVVIFRAIDFAMLCRGTLTFTHSLLRSSSLHQIIDSVPRTELGLTCSPPLPLHLVDELMGVNRNLDNEEGVIDDFRDDRVCKAFLCGLCPHDLFRFVASVSIRSLRVGDNLSNPCSG